MPSESPLFQSSLELFGHSISHFNAGNELDRKLVILHLANSIELLLKDLVLNSGASIYKSPKENITTHGCKAELSNKGVIIHQFNKIELLMDERNALQHRFGSPNELTTIFYMDIAIDFFTEILKENYGLDFDETVPQFVPSSDWHAFNMRVPNDESELENLKKLANVHPLGSLLAVTAYLEKVVNRFLDRATGNSIAGRRPFGMLSHRAISRLGLELPKDLEEKLDEARSMRNLAAHGRAKPAKSDVARAIEAVSELEAFLQAADMEAVKKEMDRRQAVEDQRKHEGFLAAIDVNKFPAGEVPQEKVDDGV